MIDIWVCSDCKSINRQRDAQCYHCRAPRTGAMETPGLDLRATNAAVERSVRAYVISWPLALITVVLLVIVALLGVWILRLRAADFPALRDAFLQALAAGKEPDAALVTSSVQIGLLSLVSTGLSLLALLCLAGWMGLVTRNVPLLGGGTPSRSPVRVFVYTLIPIFNLYKVPGMIQDLLYRVDPQEGGAFMVLAAAIGLVGSRFVNWIGSWMITVAGIRDLIPQIQRGDTDGITRTFGTILDQGYWLDVAVAIMVAIGTLLLAGIMIRIESRCAARDREIRSQMAESGAPAAPGGPAWGQPGGPAGSPGGPASAGAPHLTPGSSVLVSPGPLPVPPAPGPAASGSALAAPGPAASGPAAPAPASPALLPAAPAPASPQPYEPNFPAGRPWPRSPGTASSPAARPGASGEPAAPPPPPPSAPPVG